jgi:hypothetical protein
MKQVEYLAEFLDKELEQGRLRPSLNTTLVAETIIGTMHHFAWLGITAENPETQQEGYVQGFIDTLWKGIIANPESY